MFERKGGSERYREREGEKRQRERKREKTTGGKVAKMFVGIPPTMFLHTGDWELFEDGMSGVMECKPAESQFHHRLTEAAVEGIIW